MNKEDKEMVFMWVTVSAVLWLSMVNVFAEYVALSERTKHGGVDPKSADYQKIYNYGNKWQWAQKLIDKKK